MSLTLYGCARSRATRNIWLLNELDIAYTHVPVIQAYRLGDPLAADAPLNTRSAAFLKVNPNGHIPSIDDDGLVLHESLAINLYLARKHGGPVAPNSVQEEGLAAMWSLWAATECETHALTLLQQRAKPEAERDDKLIEAALSALPAPLMVLDHALTADSFLIGGRFTVADINVAEVVRYAMSGAPQLFDVAPGVKAWLTNCHARPGFRAMWAMREAEPA